MVTTIKKRYWTQEEVDKAKADKGIRDRLKAKIEEAMGLGKPVVLGLGGKGQGMGMLARVADEEAIRRFCSAFGIVNPLYRSRDYARNSIYGGIIAPPSFLRGVSAFFSSTVANRATNVNDIRLSSFEAGIRCEWFKVIREGDVFTVVEIPSEVVDLTREQTAVQFLVRSKKIYRNQRDEVVGLLTSSFMSMVYTKPAKPKKLPEIKVVEGQGNFPVIVGSDVAEQMKRFGGYTPQVFTEEEVEEWYRLMEAEPIRGAEFRFWEDVTVGDQLPPTHHVFTMMENFAHNEAGTHEPASWRFAMRGRMADPRRDWTNNLDPESHLPDFTGLHSTDIGGQRSGVPKANCGGNNLHCWLTHPITNWMGDAGFLKKFEDQVRRSLWRGSLATCKGEVIKKYMDGDEHCVDLHMTLEDNTGALMIPNGTATVVLPSRRMEDWRPK